MNTFLVLLLITHYLLYYIFRGKSTILSCGLFGYVGNVEGSIDKIKLLGLFNMSRGKDSCGVTINNVTTKYNNDFEAFLKYNNLPEVFDENFAIIGHDRQRSSGNLSVDNAHPFDFYREGDNKNFDTPYFIGAHNGTIYNIDELCEEYGLDPIKYDVDSKALLQILSEGNYDVLKKYYGGAALIMMKPEEKNTLYVFNGASQSTYNKNVMIADRGLHYWQKSENEMYISSEKQPLKVIGGSNDDIKEFPLNKVLKIVEGKIDEDFTIDIDRTGIEKYNTKYEYTNRNSKTDNHNRHYAYYDQYDYGNYDDQRSESNKARFPIQKVHPKPFANKEGSNKINLNKDELTERERTRLKDTIYWYKGVYRRNDCVINGIFALDDAGRLYSNSDAGKVKGVRLYGFFEGNLLINPAHVKYLEEVVGKIRSAKGSENEVIKDIAISRVVSHFTAHPICGKKQVDPSFIHFGAISSLNFTTSFNRPITLALAFGSVVTYTKEGIIFNDSKDEKPFISSYSEINLKTGEKTIKSINYDKLIKKFGLDKNTIPNSINRVDFDDDDDDVNFQTGSNTSKKESKLKRPSDIYMQSKDSTPLELLIQVPKEGLDSKALETFSPSNTQCYCCDYDGICSCDTKDIFLTKGNKVTSSTVILHQNPEIYIAKPMTLKHQAYVIAKRQYTQLEDIEYKKDINLILLHDIFKLVCTDIIKTNSKDPKSLPTNLIEKQKFLN